MKTPGRIGTLLLAIYLIIAGIVGLGGASLGQLSVLMPILAIAAGACLLSGK